MAATLDDRARKPEISATRELFRSTNIRALLSAGDQIIAARDVGSSSPSRIMLLDGWTALLLRGR